MPIAQLSIRRKKIANKIAESQKLLELERRAELKKKQLKRRAKGK